MHLRVTLARAVLGGAGDGNEAGIDQGAGLEQQAFAAQTFIDDAQRLGRELVFLQAGGETAGWWFHRADGQLPPTRQTGGALDVRAVLLPWPGR